MDKDFDWDDDYGEDWENTGIGDTKELFEPNGEDTYSFEGDEDFDDVILDIDYSELKGNFKSNIRKVKHTIKKAPRKRRKPLSKRFNVQNESTTFIKGGKKQIGRVIIPEGRDLTIQGVNKFILAPDKDADSFKNIGYYKGEKLKELILKINNTSGVDFTLELFNPSMPLDYLQNTSANLNDRITVAGDSRVSYSDLLYNFLSNPTLIPSARFIATGTNVSGQKTEKLTFTNKSVDGESSVVPLSLSLNQDLFQFQTDIILFDIMGQLDRAFIPDGMDIIQYTVLAGNSVTFCFYYKQKSLKKLLYKEARKKRMVADELKGLL